MNYTTGTPLNAIPDVAVHPTCSGLPPIGETMRKTYEILIDCTALADKLNALLSNSQDEEKRGEPPCDSMQARCMENCDLAISVMHKLELALSVLGG